MPRLRVRQGKAPDGRTRRYLPRELWRAAAFLCSCPLIVPAPAVAQEVVVQLPPVTVYEDQYLLEGSESAGSATSYLNAELPGRRQLELETVYYSNRDDLFGDETESGLRLRWLRETGNLGTFDVQAQLADVDSRFAGREGAGSNSLLTFRQSAVAISASSLMDTALGHQRIPADSLLRSGYRFRLPSTTMLGVATQVSDGRQQVRFASGKIGRYRGVRLPGFEDTGGRMTAVAYQSLVTDLLEVGTEVIAVSGDDDIRDHNSLILGMRQTAADDSREHAARLVHDSDGNFGIWSDSRQDLGANRLLRYGVFHLDPDLAWADQPAAEDQQGAYVRMSAGNSKLKLSGGYDWQQSGLRAETESVDSNTMFFNSSLRVRRDLLFGVTASLGSRVFNWTSARFDTRRLRTYSTWKIPAGGFRFEIFNDDVDGPAGDDRSRDGLATTFNWRMPERIRLSTELRLEKRDDAGLSSRRHELSAIFRYDLLDDVSMSFNTSVFRSSGDAFSGDDGLSLSAAVNWRFLPDWRASLTLTRNRTDFATEDHLLLPTTDEVASTSVWLSIQYLRRGGQSFPSIGANPGGAVGNGRVSGIVFFDENGDSIRQPSEDVAVGVVVILDGRYETRTNTQGAYSFSPVPAGEHEIVVLMDDLPLPWTLDDERPRHATVRFRENSTIDFPLIVIE